MGGISQNYIFIILGSIVGLSATVAGHMSVDFRRPQDCDTRPTQTPVTVPIVTYSMAYSLISL